MQPPPDTKDWTWTLTRRCEECALSAGEIGADQLAERLFIVAEEWVQILRSSPAVTARPEPAVWSPLEYGAHVRDMMRIFGERLNLLLTEDEPTFASWDQDATAIDERYSEQDPEVVADDIESLAQELAGRIAGLTAAQFERRGTRSNGSQFSVLTLLQYALHDLIHHLWDVTGQQDAASSLALEGEDDLLAGTAGAAGT